jgi:2-phospho-L-lactate transferase/gluconeogenesis factor (CofD/UPF0052 family)
MSKFGETDNFSAEDFVNKIEEYLPRETDRVVFNSQKPEPDIIHKYEEQKAHYIEPPAEEWREGKIITRDLLNVSGGVVRHDDVKLAKVIEELLSVL